MSSSVEAIVQEVDLTKVAESNFHRRYVGCLVLTHDHQLLFQQRGNDWQHFPGFISEFGGKIENDELPLQTLIRELNEELGAIVLPHEAIYLGAITEMDGNQLELVHTYFWQDKHKTITGCYEGQACYFANIQAARNHPKIMGSVHWLLTTCCQLSLI